MIAVIDYGVGNLFSLAASLKYIGAKSLVTADEKVIKDSSAIILPGVGAFADAYDKLEKSGLIPVIKEEVEGGKPLLGICLGMQLLFERSFEYGEHRGLGLIEGEVCPIEPDLKQKLKVPHMGWNSLSFVRPSPIYKYLTGGEYVYFVHSYYAKGCSGSVTATAEYGGIDITASVGRGNVFGTQFHPEKSGAVGLKILRAFSEL
ncbi:MAG TPA: imidazole glycerol phosphate synthase subunit HisH [Candidatus Coproplasma excrementigallinarum]|uniref:Imidazole glycerol phosphate synthase subunit HisH n=1 Tax=Candidatus Coproplasma excrementigallinarum TaxID=2840747 RepID=A0A9D1SJF1_9FIRM|nr:imidazole glycerol phosphate synthase subunit HisH [Candidatus Coproplasma excrementigallinarum]